MAILSKEAKSSRISEWFTRTYDRIYAAVVEENIPRDFQSHVLALRMMGSWPTLDNNSPWYKWLTVTYYSVFGIFISLSQSMNVLYVNSIEEIMHHSFAALSCWVTIFKVAVIYWRHDSIREYFRIHMNLLRDEQRNTAIDEEVIRINIRVHAFLQAIYNGWTIVAVCQSIFAQPADQILVSTMNMPYAFAQRPTVYWTGLMCQAVANMGITVWAAMADSLYIALINTVCGHMEQLKERLRKLGTEVGEGENRDARFYRELVDCCKCYEQCLRCHSICDASFI